MFPLEDYAEHEDFNLKKKRKKSQIFQSFKERNKLIYSTKWYWCFVIIWCYILIGQSAKYWNDTLAVQSTKQMNLQFWLNEFAASATSLDKRSCQIVNCKSNPG